MSQCSFRDLWVSDHILLSSCSVHVTFGLFSIMLYYVIHRYSRLYSDGQIFYFPSAVYIFNKEKIKSIIPKSRDIFIQMFCLIFPDDIYLFKVNNANIRPVCSKLAIKTSERRHWRHWRRSDLFIVNFEQISHIVLVFPLLTLNKYIPAGICYFMT